MDLSVKFGLLEPSGSSGAGCRCFYPSGLRKKTLHVSFYVWCLCSNVKKQTALCVRVGGRGGGLQKRVSIDFYMHRYKNYWGLKKPIPSYPWRNSPPPQWSRASHYRIFTITFRHTTLGRTPLDEWSARRRDLYLATHNTHKRKTAKLPAGFKPSVPANKLLQNQAFDLAATGIGPKNPYGFKNQDNVFSLKCNLRAGMLCKRTVVSKHLYGTTGCYGACHARPKIRVKTTCCIRSVVHHIGRRTGLVCYYLTVISRVL